MITRLKMLRARFRVWRSDRKMLAARSRHRREEFKREQMALRAAELYAKAWDDACVKVKLFPGDYELRA